MEFIQYFKTAQENLVENKTLPQCEWLDWEFMPPKVLDRGDLCTFTVLRTVMKLNKQRNTDYDPEEWCNAILRTLPVIPEVSEIYTQNGIINIRLSPQTPLNAPMKPLEFHPIGFLSSCFSEKFGTPRQSMYSKYSRGYINLLPHINSDSLDGLEEFSHIWIIFIFHKSFHSKFKTKIKPPRLNGEKKGIFATRAPHRYNPIGLSVSKIERIEERRILVSGIDIIDETPVLDIKPYHPADSLSCYKIPEYIVNPVYIYTVLFHQYALDRISFIKQRFTLKFYSSEEDWVEIITEILSQDPTTVHTKLKHSVF
jgi:tRNA-Thr(GGU) m(6)t(6)A37 methyltransferase TsaA